MEATLSSKNQVTVPKQVREYLNLKAGDRFKFFFQPDGVVAILPVTPIARLKGSLPKLDHTVTLDEIESALAKSVKARFRR